MVASENSIGNTVLNMAMQIRPRMTLQFFEHAILMHKDLPDGSHTEYPIDPTSLATVLAERLEYNTGLLSPNTLYIGQIGVQRTVVEYRPPQITAFWLEGSAEAFRIPMCPLIMVRTTKDGRSPLYKVFAVKSRPLSLDVKLYQAPLPNVSNMGVCWGTVATPTKEELAGVSLEPDWRQFLGSRFGNHSLEGKSKKYRKDARKLYMEITGAKRYPLKDLIALSTTLDDVIE